MNSNLSSEKQLEEMREHQKNKKLVSSEIGDLFANYLGDSLFSCVFKHHLIVVEDEEVKEFMKFALETSERHLQLIKEICEKENIQIPVGFGEEDIRRKAPRLFSDIFMVFYITEMSRAGLQT